VTHVLGARSENPEQENAGPQGNSCLGAILEPHLVPCMASVILSSTAIQKDCDIHLHKERRWW